MMIFGDPFVYWGLKIFLAIILVVCGYVISFKVKSKNEFWKVSIIPIIAYSLEMGLRWNRSWDYPHYYQDLVGKLYQDYDDLLYLAWLDFFKFTGLPYWVAFIFYSAILIYGFLTILQQFPKTAVWALPLFLFIPSGADNHTRQFFAIAFALIGYSEWLKKKYLKAFLYCGCCLSIHFANIFLILVMIFFSIVKCDRIIKNPVYLMIAYTLLSLYWNPQWLEGVASVLMKVDAGDSVAGRYLSHSDYWLSDESNIANKTGAKVFAVKFYFVILSLFIKNGLIYYGSKLVNKNSKYNVFFFSTLLILVIEIIGGSMEIFYRFVAQLQCFEAFLMGGIWLYVQDRSKIERNLVLILGCYYFGWVCYFRNILEISLTGYAYIWDI